MQGLKAAPILMREGITLAAGAVDNSTVNDIDRYMSLSGGIQTNFALELNVFALDAHGNYIYQEQINVAPSYNVSFVLPIITPSTYFNIINRDTIQSDFWLYVYGRDIPCDLTGVPTHRVLRDTKTPLGAGGTDDTNMITTYGFNKFAATATANVAGTLKVKWYGPQKQQVYEEQVAVGAGGFGQISRDVIAPFVSVHYINGGAAQASFGLNANLFRG